MSAATVPRRKQAKPQRLATTSNQNEEDEVIPSKRLRNTPLSIEEQFQKQFSQSFETHLLQKAKHAVAQFNSNSELNIPPLDLNTDFLAHAAALKQSSNRSSDYDEETETDTNTNEIKAVNLLLPTAATAADEAKNNFLFESLNTQQFLQLYNDALAAQNVQHQTNQDVEEQQQAPKDSSQRQDTNSATTSCLLSPPNSSFNDIASSTASSSSNVDRFVCPLAECSQHFPNIVLQMLHLSEEHREYQALHCASCDERFSDLSQLRKHDCQREELLQRCASTTNANNAVDDIELEERAQSEPPNLECSWPDFRLPSEKHDTSAWSKIGMEAPPLLMNEASNNESMLAANGLKEMGLLAMRNQNPPFPFQTFAPSIPNFVPPHASSGTPPRGNRQFTPNEDDWEAMMEISAVDETEKIRALVGDKAMPVTDPNQCLLCRRVLSCKSALQMHYRTHTGERPFKCKICQRAFTTKGNLKTHMGVHRQKHTASLRGMGQPTSSGLSSPTSSSLNHQCPICQKRFFSTQILQQHMIEHTSQLTNRPTDLQSTPNFAQLFGSNADKKAPMLPQSTPPAGFPHLPFLPPNFLQFGGMMNPMNPFLSSPAHFAQSLMQQQKDENGVPKSEVSHKHGVDLLASLGLPPFKMPRLDVDLNIKSEVKEEEDEEKDEDQHSATITPQPRQSITPQDLNENNSLDSIVQEPVQSSPQNENSTPTTSRQATKSDENPLEAIQKMWESARTPSAPTHPPIQLSKHQCAVCFKHFSSSSALQIHTRTHTGDKPFKCEICSRAFTTRGNLKVHMSTHSYQTSPSRRGRRIFDFGTDSLFRTSQQGNPFSNSSQPNTPVTAPTLGNSPFAFPAMGNNPAAMMSFPPFLAAMMASMNGKEPENGQQADPAVQAQLNAMMWMFKNVCTVCQKVCTSPDELQQHLKTHIDGNVADAKENSTQ